MDRQEFLYRLEEALQDEVPEQVLNENLRYYREYISEQISKGSSEQEVMEFLGDPRLIARSIIDAANAEAGEYHYTYQDAGGAYEYQDADARKEAPYEEARTINLASWKVTLAVVLGLVVLLGLLSLVFSLALHLLLSPVFWVVVIVWVLWRHFFRYS